MPNMIVGRLLRGLPGGMTYYVDATLGNDANSGKSPALPWQTVAKVNATPFKPGDRIFFKRGETWTGTILWIPSSGVPGRGILFGAYGTGAQPIIDLTNTETRAIHCVSVNYVTIKDLCFKGSTLHSIYVLTSSHILIDTCTVIGNGVSLANGIEVDGAAATSHHITIRNCDVSNCMIIAGGGGGIAVGMASLGTDFIVIENNICHNNGTSTSADHGIYVKLPATSAIVRNNTCYSNSAGGIKVNGNVAGFLVYGNKCYSNYAGIFLDTFTNGSVYNNLYYNNNNQTGIWILSNSGNCYISHNTCINHGTSALQCTDGATAINGVVIKNNIFAQDYSIGGNHLLVRFTSAAVIAQNTWDYNLYAFIGGATTYIAITYSPLTPRTFAEWKVLAGESHGMMADPVFASSAHTTIDADSSTGQKVLNVTSTTGFNPGENIVINPWGAREEKRVIDTIQAGVSLTLTVNLTNTHTALQADIVLSSVYTDLHLQVTSPCIAAGDATVGVLTDYDSVVRGVAVDIGAYEFA